MTENPKSFWQRQQERPVRLFGLTALFSLVSAIGISFLADAISRGPHWSNFLTTAVVIGTLVVFIVSVIGFVFALAKRTRPLVTWALRRWIFCLAATITLITLFYAEENWRGRRAWDKCKQELEAQGHVLDWDKFVPAPVPDDQNFFKAAHMAEWFVKSYNISTSNSLSARLANPKTDSVGSSSNAIATAAQAREYLAWSSQFDSDFNLLRDALKRPYFRMDSDYAMPFEIPIPNFITVRAVARILAQRAHCYLLLNEPDKAVQELQSIREMCRMLECNRPMTLVAAMINVAVTGLYVETINEGFRLHVWQESQLLALQKQLTGADVMQSVFEAMQTEPAMSSHSFEMLNGRLFKYLNNYPARQGRPWAEKDLLTLWPTGWTYQNMAVAASLHFTLLRGVNISAETISPGEMEKQSAAVSTFLNKRQLNPYKIMAAIAIPNFTKAWQTVAHHQMLVNEAQIACALERYHFVHGEYPETLDALTPQFIEKVPHDVINGQPLHYRRTSEGKFLLYSVGWNEADDGGNTVEEKLRTDYSKGDWVWKLL